MIAIQIPEKAVCPVWGRRFFTFRERVSVMNQNLYAESEKRNSRTILSASEQPEAGAVRERELNQKNRMETGQAGRQDRPVQERRCISMLPVIDMELTGANIARLRRKAGMTVRDLQDVFGFATPQAIYKWQRGAALPTIDNLAVLAVLFGIHMDDILVFQKNITGKSA